MKPYWTLSVELFLSILFSLILVAKRKATFMSSEYNHDFSPDTCVVYGLILHKTWIFSSFFLSYVLSSGLVDS